MTDKMGEWRWFVGHDEFDEEMLDSGTREQAILDGTRHYGPRFYIVEARMFISDEAAMERGKKESARFAESRNGEWIKP